MFASLLFCRKLHVFLFPLLRFMLLCLQIMNRIFCTSLRTTYDLRWDDHIHNNTTFSEYKRKPEVETQIFTNIHILLASIARLWMWAYLSSYVASFFFFFFFYNACPFSVLLQYSLPENNNQQQNTIMINISPVWFSPFLLFSSRVNITACMNQQTYDTTTTILSPENFPVLLRQHCWKNERTRENEWMNEKWFTFQITLHLRLSIYISLKQ